MISFEHVSVIYPSGVAALDDVSIDIAREEFAFLVGPTGQGKSTFLRLIYREILPTQGRVIVEGKEVTRLSPGQIPRLRRRMGVVFQDFRLLPQRTVWENIAFALHATGTSRRTIGRRVPELLSRVGLLEKSYSYPAQLSAGEQQRTSLARALATNPPILLADEPTGNLDPETSWELMQLLDEINQAGTTIVIATHDQLMVDAMRRRVITLYQGQIVSDLETAAYPLARA